MSLTTWLAYIMGVVYTVVIILCDPVFNYLACLYNGCGLHCKLLYFATMSLTTWLAYIMGVVYTVSYYTMRPCL